MTAETQAFIEAEKQADRNVLKACELLVVSRSAFYGRLAHTPSVRELSDAELIEKIKAIHAASGGTYGAPRILDELREEGLHVSKKRVARLMIQAGLAGRCRRRSRRTTFADPKAKAFNLLARNFDPENLTLDTTWAGDVTYVRTWEGWAYLATVIDLASRRVVGWAMSDHMEASLVCDAMKMALIARRPAPGLLFHSDRGSQGGFNWTSQHLDHGGVHGTTVRMDSHDRRSPGGAQEEPTEGHPHLSRPDPLPGRADDRLAGRSGSVLGSDRSRGENRRRRHRGGRLIPRRV
jgi:HTH-like domain/Integrase core domain